MSKKDVQRDINKIKRQLKTSPVNVTLRARLRELNAELAAYYRAESKND